MLLWVEVSVDIFNSVVREVISTVACVTFNEELIIDIDEDINEVVELC